MIVVINPEGQFISRLHAPTAEDLARPDVVTAPDVDHITNEYRLVNGQWVAPPPVQIEGGGVSTPPRR